MAISGWGLAPQGTEKLSKSRGGGPMSPMAMIEKYSSDAVRYWAASTGLGKDSVINEEKIQAGGKLVTKLWNVARFCERFLVGYYATSRATGKLDACRSLAPLQDATADPRVHRSIRGIRLCLSQERVEAFFWRDLADNYLEMAKSRLYDEQSSEREGARYALHAALLAVVKLFAPFLPHVTEAIYLGLFAADESRASGTSRWMATGQHGIDRRAGRDHG